MDIKDLLSNGQVLDQLARSAGVGPEDARKGLEAMLPSVVRGLERNAGSADGLQALGKALGSGNHTRYLDAPETLGEEGTKLDGNAVLGHIFGSKDVSRNVAAHAAGDTGIDPSPLRKMLPLIASLAMAALSKNSDGGRKLPASEGKAGGLLGAVLGTVLTGLANSQGGKDGDDGKDSPLDGILDLAKKYF